jgi:transcriptional antiterminator NusG
VVHAYSGMEKAVERNITERINRAGMQDKFGRILVPTEEVVEIKNGQKRTTERRFFPGYVLVEMIMDDESWHLVKHTNKVTVVTSAARRTARPPPAKRGRGDIVGPDAARHRRKPRHKVELHRG